MKFKSTIYTACKLIVTIIGLLVVFHSGKIRISELVIHLTSIRIEYYILSLTTFILLIIYVTRRWSILLSSRGIILSFRELVNINFIGCFFNLFLPSSFGGDLIRAIYIKEKKISWRVSVSSVFLDRLLGIISLFILAFISIIILSIFKKSTDTRLINYLVIGSILISITWIILIYLHLIVKMLLDPNRSKLKKYLDKYEHFSESIKLSTYPKAVILRGLSISLIGNLLSVLSLYFLTIAMKLNIGLTPILVVFPLITVISMIPISIGGIGLREGSFVYFISEYSVSTSNAFALSLLYFSCIVFLGIIGGIIFSFSKYTLVKKDNMILEDSKQSVNQS